MSGVTEKRADFSIWDSVVNDRIVQFEDLDQKYRNRGKKIEALAEENEILRTKMEEVSAKFNSVSDELNEKDAQIKELSQEVSDLKQWIVNMENSTCWKLTMPLRRIIDKCCKR